MSEIKESGFSYESPVKQRKSAVRLLVIELSALVVAILVIVGILNYLGIFSISKINPTLFGWVPVKEEVQIAVVNQTPGYKVELRGQGELMRVLKDWGILDNHLDWGSFGRTGNEKIKNIAIVITDQVITENATVNAEGEVQIGSRASLVGQNLEVRIYVNPVVWQTGEGEFVNGNAVLMGFITPIYRATFPSTIDEPNRGAPKLFDVIGQLAPKKIFSVREL